MSTDYVAPAAKLVTVLHIKDPTETGFVSSPGQIATYGVTLCGLPLYAAELWQLVERLPGEKVCPRCLNPGSDEGDQGTLL